jgi:hypothetical protein
MFYIGNWLLNVLYWKFKKEGITSGDPKRGLDKKNNHPFALLTAFSFPATLVQASLTQASVK